MFCASMPSSGWSPKQGQWWPPGSVVLILKCVQVPRGSAACLTAISSLLAVNVSFRKTMLANQVWVAGSYWQRGSLVNCLKPSPKRALTLVGPATLRPFSRKTRKAEFTGSSTNPVETQRRWSGGSNSAPKFVSALSRLLTPLKLRTSPADDAALRMLADGGTSGTAPPSTGWVGRAPRSGAVVPCAEAPPAITSDHAATLTASSIPTDMRFPRPVMEPPVHRCLPNRRH